MKVEDFNINKGIFHFEIEDLDASFHSHPAVEVIFASKGRFSLVTEEASLDNLKFAIIDSNVNHRIFSASCTVSLLMLESYNSSLKDFLSDQRRVLSNGTYTTSQYKKYKTLFLDLKDFSI